MNSFLRKVAGEQKTGVGYNPCKNRMLPVLKSDFPLLYFIWVSTNIMGNLSLDMEHDKFASMQMRIITAFEEGRLGDVLLHMQTYFGPVNFSFVGSYLKMKKRKVLDMITYQSMKELEENVA
jgi:hypothetical protein